LAERSARDESWCSPVRFSVKHRMDRSRSGSLRVGPTFSRQRCAGVARSKIPSMIRIPKTELMVGSSEAERRKLAQHFDFHQSLLADELPARKATVNEFWIDEFPVTNAEYAAFLQATKRAGPFGWTEWATRDRADHPVVGVSFADAQAYAAWAGKRLPTPE